MNILMRKGKLILAIALVLGSLNVNAGVPAKVKPTKNLVLMITDGTSTSLLATARWYRAVFRMPSSPIRPRQCRDT